MLQRGYFAIAFAALLLDGVTTHAEMGKISQLAQERSRASAREGYLWPIAVMARKKAVKSLSRRKHRDRVLNFHGVALRKNRWPDVMEVQGIDERPYWRRATSRLARILGLQKPPPPFKDDVMEMAASSGRNKQRSTRYHTGEYMPGYNLQPLFGYAGPHFLSLSPIAILANSEVTEAADLFIYPHYDFHMQESSFIRLIGVSKTYVVRGKLVYRWKPEDKDQNIIGIEVALPMYEMASLKKNSSSVRVGCSSTA